MAGAIALAVALSRLVTTTCPHCGHTRAGVRRAEHRVCTRCRKRYREPTR